MKLLDEAAKRIQHGSTSTVFNLGALVLLLVAVLVAVVFAVTAH